jgi:hypothetical protein
VAEETDGDRAAEPCGDVERYEQLRASALAGESETFRMGLALLYARGLAAWARELRSIAVAPPVVFERDDAVEPHGSERDLVAVLATMALASVGQG